MFAATGFMLASKCTSKIKILVSAAHHEHPFDEAKIASEALHCGGGFTGEGAYKRDSI